MLRRALVQVESRGLLRSLNHLPPSAASRSFTSSSGGANAPSKWPKRLLIAGAVVGIAKYLFREPPEVKEGKRLLMLAEESASQGNNLEATKYISRSFDAIKDISTPRATIQLACACAALWEEVNEHEAALPYYQSAMKNLKAVNPISDRCVVGVGLMDRMAQCYQRLGRDDTAEKMFKQAIRLYEKYHGQFSGSSSLNSKRVVAKLDGRIGDVLVHYSQLLVSMKRDSEVSLVRQRFVEIVNASPLLKGQERSVLDLFDDMMALHSIREKRRRERGGDHDA